jgi:hypothetical protein
MARVYRRPVWGQNITRYYKLENCFFSCLLKNKFFGSFARGFQWLFLGGHATMRSEDVTSLIFGQFAENYLSYSKKEVNRRF